MPRYVIHIGPHKTGSTFLQAGFQALRPKLLEQGICYPEQWQGADRLSHHPLVARLRAKDAALQSEFAELNASSHEVVVISAEDIADLGSEQLGTFRNLLGKAPAIIVFYCRRWSELLPSGWQEMIKHGSRAAFPAFLSEHLINTFGSHLINYGQRIAKFAQHFGDNNVRVVSYNNVLEKGGDLFTHFCTSFLLWQDPPQLGPERVNASLSLVDIEIIRVLNALAVGRVGDPGTKMFLRYMRMRREFDLSDIGRLIGNSTATITLNEGVGSLQSLHREIFGKFGNMLVEPKTGTSFFAPRRADIPYVQQDYLLWDDAVQMLRDLYDKVQSQG